MIRSPFMIDNDKKYVRLSTYVESFVPLTSTHVYRELLAKKSKTITISALGQFNNSSDCPRTNPLFIVKFYVKTIIYIIFKNI